jgi:hypothetical protein
VSSRRLLSAFALLASLIVAACGTPPDKELQEAQAAIDAARTAGADRYATEEFTAAQAALAKANDAVAQRDYRLALNNALDARERAQNASKEVAGRLAAAKREADTAMKDADAALHDTHAKLKAAETARVAGSMITDAQTSIAAADTALQEARTLAGRGDFQGAKDRAVKTTATLRRISLDLQNAVSDATHRRRPAPRKR